MVYNHITSLDALFEHTAQGHHWVVGGLESLSLPEAVHIPGVDPPLEPEGWAVVGGNLTPHCPLKGDLWHCLMTGSRLMCFQDLWQLVWFVHC